MTDFSICVCGLSLPVMTHTAGPAEARARARFQFHVNVLQIKWRGDHRFAAEHVRFLFSAQTQWNIISR